MSIKALNRQEQKDKWVFSRWREFSDLPNTLEVSCIHITTKLPNLDAWEAILFFTGLLKGSMLFNQMMSHSSQEEKEKNLWFPNQWRNIHNEIIDKVSALEAPFERDMLSVTYGAILVLDDLVDIAYDVDPSCSENRTPTQSTKKGG